MGFLVFALGLLALAVVYPLAAPREALTFWTYIGIWPLAVFIVLIGWIDLTQPGLRGEGLIGLGLTLMLASRAAQKRWGS